MTTKQTIFVRFSDPYLKTGPFDNRTQIVHSKPDWSGFRMLTVHEIGIDRLQIDITQLSKQSKVRSTRLLIHIIRTKWDIELMGYRI